MNRKTAALSSCEFRHLLRVGRMAIGGNYSYGVFLVLTDASCLCWKCANEEKRLISRAAYAQDACHDGWAPLAFDINYESEIACDHCGAEIESIYGVPEEES